MNQARNSLYKTSLMAHFKQPKFKHAGPFPENMSTARGSNPRCGDDIEVGLSLNHGHSPVSVDKIGFRGRGCSVCLASASMMTESVANLNCQQVLALADLMARWIEKDSDVGCEIPHSLQPISAVKDHPARKKCVMLPWHAVRDAINKALGNGQ